MKIEIKHRHSGSVLFSAEVGSLKLAVELAVKGGANLRGANLCSADLRGAYLCSADLCSADLCGAYLRGANLCSANLRGANLCSAYLRGAYLSSADLRDAYLNWSSHVLLSEILFRAAGADIGKRKLAGLVLISTDWCWPQFLAMDDPLRGWALETLAEYVKEGDGAPAEVRAFAKKKVKP